MKEYGNKQRDQLCFVPIALFFVSFLILPAVVRANIAVQGLLT